MLPDSQLSPRPPAVKRRRPCRRPDLLPIRGFSGHLIGRDGTLWAPARGGGWRKVKVSRNQQTGYAYATIARDDGKKVSVLVHRLVLLAFVGDPPPGTETCHEDNDRMNPVLSNLRWDTHAANSADKVRHGTHKQGVEIFGAKLNAEKVRVVRDLVSRGHSHREVAAAVGVHQSTVTRLMNGRIWSHVTSGQA